MLTEIVKTVKYVHTCSWYKSWSTNRWVRGMLKLKFFEGQFINFKFYQHSRTLVPDLGILF